MDVIDSLIKLIDLYKIILIARAVSSWIAPGNYYKQPFKFLIDVTEPVLIPLRRVIPPVGMIDISFMALFFLLALLQFALQQIHFML